MTNTSVLLSPLGLMICMNWAVPAPRYLDNPIKPFPASLSHVLASRNISAEPQEATVWGGSKLGLFVVKPPPTYERKPAILLQ